MMTRKEVDELLRICPSAREVRVAVPEGTTIMPKALAVAAFGVCNLVGELQDAPGDQDLIDALADAHAEFVKALVEPTGGTTTTDIKARRAQAAS